MPEATITTDHAAIRRWTKTRGGHPARVRGTQTDGKPGGVLRIDFDPPDPGLERIEWDEFFAIFDDRELGFLHQDRTEEGAVSRFNKLVEPPARKAAGPA